MSQLHIIDHPMIQHKLSIMRDIRTGAKDFRQLLTEISLLMGYEVTRDLPLEPVEIETPMCKTTARVISGKKLAIVPILRAGLGMVDGLLTLLPVAKVGHIGLYRDETTHLPGGCARGCQETAEGSSRCGYLHGSPRRRTQQ